MTRQQPTIRTRAHFDRRLTVLLFGLLSGCNSDPPVTDSVVAKSRATGSPASANHTVANLIGSEIDQFSVPEPSPSEPVKAAILIRPVNVSPGETAELLVYVRVASAHYLHAADSSDQTFIPVSIDVALPHGVEAASDWQFPTPEKVHGNALGYRNSVLLIRSVKLLSSVPEQTLHFQGELRYQACTEELCWPPGKIELSAALTVRSQTR
jgi:hypothetical protein